MRKLILLSLLIAALPACASPKPEPEYQEAVLKSFAKQQHGRSCSTNGDTTGRVNATTDSDGQTTGTVNSTTSSSTTCRPIEVAYYTVTVGPEILVLTPAPSLAKLGAAVLTLGISSAFYKNSALYGQLPGAVVKIRSSGSGNFFVKVGKRESEYKLVSASAQ